jgi:hypothetical protein
MERGEWTGMRTRDLLGAGPASALAIVPPKADWLAGLLGAKIPVWLLRRITLRSTTARATSDVAITHSKGKRLRAAARAQNDL